jgi:hypothetical protein
MWMDLRIGAAVEQGKEICQQQNNLSNVGILYLCDDDSRDRQQKAYHDEGALSILVVRRLFSTTSDGSQFM